MTGWTAEVFVPYELLKPLGNVPPTAGHAVAGQLLSRRLRRRARDQLGLGAGRPSFHEFRKFGTLVFE